MSDTRIKPLIFALGASFVSSSAVFAETVDTQNPFNLADIETGYLVANSSGTISQKHRVTKNHDIKKSAEAHDEMVINIDKEIPSVAQRTAIAQKLFREGNCGEGSCGGSHSGSK